MTQQARRHDPYPWTWEVPVGVITLVLLVLGLGVQLGRAIANLLAGEGWHLPSRINLFNSLPAVLTGDPAAGLPAALTTTASPALLWGCITVTDTALLALCVVLIKLGMDRWGPGRMKGMASRHEAEQLLGRTRLRKNAPIIRPDLHRNQRQ